MYGWIWRRLPFGLPGKLAGSFLLVAAAAATLWLWVFPWLDPLLPFDDVRVDQLPVLPADAPTVPAPGTPAPSPTDPFALPYSTVTNNPATTTPAG